MIDFRPLSLWDAPRAASLIRAAFSAQGPLTTPPSSALTESAGIVERKLLEGGGAGAFVGDELIGLILWAPDGDALYLGRLAVEPERRGQGLGARLLALGETEALRRGFVKTRLRVRLELPLNRKFLARLGYEQVSAGAHPGHDHPTFAILEKRVERPAPM
jgi:GNAT superfamily N-acetyltransferase